MMQAGIDSFSYHRYFGETFPQQAPLDRRMSMEDLLRRTKEMGAEGISIESCFLPRFDQAYLADLKALLDDLGLARAYAWGHPRGLEAGKSEKAFAEMLGAFRHAQLLGASVMRVVSSNRIYRDEPHGPQLARLKELYRKAVKVAEEYGIKIAIENHLDYHSTELLEILEAVDSPYVGITFDSGNFVRLNEDPVEAMRRLAPAVLATHLKDLRVMPGVPADQWCYYATVPLGDGIVDNGALVKLLHAAGYQGLLAVEIDLLHPDYSDEDAAVARSVANIKQMIAAAQAQR